MSISLEAPVMTAKSERHSSLSPAQIMDIARAREASLSRLLMAYISSGLVFMLLPGTFLGVWNLLQISGRESVASVSPAWLQAHGHAQVFGWIGSFILGIGFYSIPKLRGATKLAFGAAWACWAMWTIGVAVRWAANVYAWQWRLLLPLSGVLELAAFLIFFRAVSQHRPEDSGKDRLEPWIWVVISASTGLILSLIANLVACLYLALRGASPALSHSLDQRYLVLVAWGFLVPFVWGFSTKWMTVFLGLRPVRPRLLLSALVLNSAGIVLTLMGWGSEATPFFVVSTALAIAAIRMFEPARQEPKTRGVHPSFPFFVRVAYGWLIGGSVTWCGCGGLGFVWRDLGRFPARADRRIHRRDGLLRRAAHFARVRGDAAIVEYPSDVCWTRAPHDWMYSSRFQRGPRISGICELGVVRIAGFGAA